MKVNVKKTKVMKISRQGKGVINICIDGKRVEQVTCFKYLGCCITEDGTCKTEIRARISMAKAAFVKRKELLTRKMSRTLKKRIIKTVIWSVALYGAETWTLKKEDMKRLNSPEMWMWRRMEKISWTERKTDEAILNTIREERALLKVITQRKKNWIGHVLRGKGLLKEVVEGKMGGKKKRGRPRIGMLDDLKEGSYVNMKRRADDRDKWRSWVPRTCR